MISSLRPLLLAACVGASSQGYAKDCQINPKTVTVEWTGYKTPKKIPVSGTFTQVDLKGGKGSSIIEALKSLSFTIQGTKVDSGDKARDAKIGNLFFGTMGGGQIAGKVKKIEKDYAYVDLSMNKVSHEVPLKLTISGRKVVGVGVIDILDFSGSKSLAQLTKACFAKHEGKTWSEAGVKVTAACK